MNYNQLVRERRKLREQIDNALQEEDDPLAAYDQFVKWTIKNYAEEDSESGLVALLEEATGKFKDDSGYKSDLRYLKLWCQYARHVDSPVAVFALLVENDIGARFAMLYEEYAKALEAEGRHQDADRIYRQGIKRNARPVERLKKQYKDFQERPSSSSARPATVARPKVSTQTASSSQLPSSSSSAQRDPFMHIYAPTAPGRRPERLRFDLSLLLTEEGVEYSGHEARARSLGLLGKKWAAPPEADRHSIAVPVNFNDDGQRTIMGITRRKSVGMRYEPTVTINTKEALADVFGMYNSPEKTLKVERPGSKHAPVKKVEPLTPAPPVRPPSNENASAMKTPAFQPFVDENAPRKENTTPAPKFKPFVDSDAAVTPDINRRALSTKDSGAPTPSLTNRPKLVDKAKASVLQPVSEEGANPNVFSKVFTPKGSPKDVFSDDFRDPVQLAAQPEAINVFQAPTTMFASSSPVTDTDAKTPFKVFSRPPDQINANVFTPKSSVFTPFIDGAGAARVAFGERTPRSPQADLEDEYEAEDNIEEGYQEENTADDSIEVHTPDVEEAPAFRVPLGGRFGQFNVMTPITERTYDFTTSTRGMSTPRDEDAVETAERLAAELREDEANEHEQRQQGDFKEDEFDSSFGSYDEEPVPPFRVSDAYAIPVDVATLEERTETLSMADSLIRASSFKPSNPCNPFDAPVVSTLLSRIPCNSGFYDLRNEEAGLLEGLQKFAHKRARQSGNTTSRSLDDMGFPLTLADRQFNVSDKLGEGGFGAVFAAKEAKYEEESFIEDDEDEDGPNMVAIKVVKPKNLWEFHILQRVHRALPTHLHRSVVLPHALYAYRDESFLVLDLCPQGTLLDIVNRASQAGISQQGACLDELLVMFFSIELLRLIEGMHSAGFIHGDLKIDNCLLRLEDVPGGASGLSSIYSPSGEQGWSCKGIKLIDFGRTIETALFPVGQQFIADWPVDAKDCLEMRENRPWTYQADYYGLAGVIYCLLFGKYIEASSVAVVPPTADRSAARYKVATLFKRYWQGSIWSNLFDILLNSGSVRPGGQLPLCEELRTARREMETWLQANCNRSSGTLKGLLKKIELSVYSR